MQHQQDVRGIIEKMYEQRSVSQNSLVEQFLSRYFPEKILRWAGLYLQRVKGPATISCKEFSVHSSVMYGGRKLILRKDEKIIINEGTYAYVLDRIHEINCQALAGSTTEKEKSFIYGSQYLRLMPKKRFYQILRSCRILTYSFGQRVYKEGQKISNGEIGSGLFLVRSGEFCYCKYSQKEEKQLSLFTFQQGYLFGTQQLANSRYPIKRQFSLECRSAQGVLYNFTQQIYNSYIKPYCESIINLKQHKISQYLEDRQKKVQHFRSTQHLLMSKTVASDRFKLGELIRVRGSKRTEIDSATIKTERYTEREASKKQSRESSEQKERFFQLKKLQKSKQYSEKMRQNRKKSNSLSKGQILFNFFKNTWQFERQNRFHQRVY